MCRLPPSSSAADSCYIASVLASSGQHVADLHVKDHSRPEDMLAKAMDCLQGPLILLIDGCDESGLMLRVTLRSKFCYGIAL